MKYTDKLRATAYGLLVNKFKEKVSKNNKKYYILYLRTQNEDKTKTSFYPFWWIVPDNFKSTHKKEPSEVINSLIHNFVSISYEQSQVGSDYVVNLVNKIDLVEKNQYTKETEFINVINNFPKKEEESNKKNEMIQDNAEYNFDFPDQNIFSNKNEYINEREWVNVVDTFVNKETFSMNETETVKQDKPKIITKKKKNTIPKEIEEMSEEEKRLANIEMIS